MPSKCITIFILNRVSKLLNDACDCMVMDWMWFGLVLRFCMEEHVRICYSRPGEKPLAQARIAYGSHLFMRELSLK